jgi:hypothetical protein
VRCAGGTASVPGVLSVDVDVRWDGGPEARLKELEEDDARLMRLATHQALDTSVLNGMLRKYSLTVEDRLSRQESARISEHNACRLVGTERASFRYASSRGGQAELEEWTNAIAGARRRFGYRRPHRLLRPEGKTVT